jgi:hypothetical protein
LPPSNNRPLLLLLLLDLLNVIVLIKIQATQQIL